MNAFPAHELMFIIVFIGKIPWKESSTWNHCVGIQTLDGKNEGSLELTLIQFVIVAISTLRRIGGLALT